MTSTASVLLEQARSVAKIIRQEADHTEAEGQLSLRAHEALANAGLYWICIPLTLGGADADVETSIAVVEEISCADGASGWSFFVNAATIGSLVPFLSEEALSHLFADGKRPVCAGQLVPVGQSRKTENGYDCIGQHSFASGSAHANWICAGQFEYDGDTPLLNDDGSLRSTMTLFPRDEVTFKGNWDVMGLAGTGSYDFEVNQTSIPHWRVLDGNILAPGTAQLRGSAMLGMGPFVVALCLHTACVLGITRRAIEEIVALAQVKTRPGYTGKICDDPVFCNELAFMDAEYYAVRGRVAEAFRNAETQVARHGVLAPGQQAILHQTATWAHRRAGEITAFCFRWAGTTPVRNPSPLGRCMRDILAANSHLLFDPMTLTNAAPEILRFWSRSKL